MAFDKKEYDFAYTKQWRIDNREDYLANRRAYKKRVSATEAGKLQRRKEALKHYYGITLEQYDNMLAKQNGCCAVCGKNTPGHNHKHFSVNHDHETGEIRGLLCNDCNRGIGLLGDNAENIKKALEYLQKGEQCESL